MQIVNNKIVIMNCVISSMMSAMSASYVNIKYLSLLFIPFYFEVNYRRTLRNFGILSAPLISVTVNLK